MTAVYLGPDWEELYPDIQSALEDAAEREPAHTVRSACREASTLLTSAASEKEIEAAMDRIALAYYPPGDGLTYREFLGLVVKRLSEPPTTTTD